MSSKITKSFRIKLTSIWYPIENASNSRPKNYMPKISARVCILQRIVKTVAVTVKVLAIVWTLYIVVGTEEASKNRVVQTTVHVNYVKLREHLMTCIATVQTNTILSNGLPTPCIVAGIEHLRTVFFSNAKYIADIVRKGNIIFESTILLYNNGITIEIIELARSTILGEIDKKQLFPEKN